MMYDVMQQCIFKMSVIVCVFVFTYNLTELALKKILKSSKMTNQPWMNRAAQGEHFLAAVTLLIFLGWVGGVTLALLKIL
uniref:Uncharacterized protein n=1 Tax=Anguilla anguilla TaxID=7936 RepID=A0A0E9R8V5_ANGAN